MNESQFEARRLPSSSARARPGAARASRSSCWPAGPADFWLLEHRMLLSLCARAKVLPHVAAFIAAMSPAAPVSGARHAPWAGLASVEHLHRERFVTGSAGARGARSQYDFRPKCSYASLRQKAALHEVTKRVSNFF